VKKEYPGIIVVIMMSLSPQEYVPAVCKSAKLLAGQAGEK
jgi:hypothetical protein